FSGYAVSPAAAAGERGRSASGGVDAEVAQEMVVHGLGVAGRPLGAGLAGRRLLRALGVRARPRRAARAVVPRHGGDHVLAVQFVRDGSVRGAVLAGAAVLGQADHAQRNPPSGAVALLLRPAHDGGWGGRVLIRPGSRAVLRPVVGARLAGRLRPEGVSRLAAVTPGSPRTGDAWPVQPASTPEWRRHAHRVRT